MKSFDTELKKYAEKVRLKTIERTELRERILSYMEYHPLPKQRTQISADTPVFGTEQYITVPFNNFYIRVVGSVLGLFILIVVPLVAERSVPGDMLYLVKTEINEEIRTYLADSPYEKVALETKLIERRIAEARLLASEGKLTDEVQTEIAQTVKVHASAVQDGLAELRESDIDEAAIAEIAFSSALDVQSAVLDTQIQSGSSTSVAIIQEAVNNARDEMNTNKSDTTPSFEGIIARIESETTRAYELFESIKVSATEEDRADIGRRLADIDRMVLGAREDQASTTLDNTVVVELTSALGFIQKLIVFMTDIDVHETVALETLVPMTLTAEERTSIAQTQLQELMVLYTTISEQVTDVENVNLSKKATIEIEILHALIGRATTSLEMGDIDGVESALMEAIPLAHDIENILAPKDTSSDTTAVDIDTNEDVENVVATTTEGFPAEENTADVPKTGTSTSAQ